MAVHPHTVSRVVALLGVLLLACGGDTVEAPYRQIYKSSGVRITFPRENILFSTENTDATYLLHDANNEGFYFEQNLQRVDGRFIKDEVKRVNLFYEVNPFVGCQDTQLYSLQLTYQQGGTSATYKGSASCEG